MSTEQNQQAQEAIKLNGLFVFKEGMASVYDEKGEAVPVTVLRYEPWIVSQLKNNENDGYAAVQIACRPKKEKNANAAEKGHFKKAGFDVGLQFVREIRQEAPEGVKLGARVDIESLKKGDVVKMTGVSKGQIGRAHV